jgi:hypothetical protein
MSHERNLDYLNRRRIIYRRHPITDEPTTVYDWGMYYENGTYECFELFRTDAKINTFKSLKWHLLVLWYLNSHMDQDDLNSLAKFICIKSNGFVTFEVSEYILKNIIYEVSMCDLDIQPKNKIRKIIFKPFCGLTKKEKLSIVGKMIGRSKQISQDDIYECMLEINDNKNKITITGLAKMLSCSTRTIYRTINNELKKEKELLNQGL